MTVPFWLPDEFVFPDDGNNGGANLYAPVGTTDPIGGAYAPDVTIYPWDKVTINGEVLPGICKITIPMIMIRLDDHKQPGFNGSPFVPLGQMPATVDLDWKLVTPHDWDKAQDWIDKLWMSQIRKWGGAGNLQRTKQLTKQQAADVVPVWELHHPSMVYSGIDKLAVMGYQPPHDAPEGPQVKQVKFKFRQWSPAPRKAPSKTRPVAQDVHPSFRLNAPANQAADPPSKTDVKKR